MNIMDRQKSDRQKSDRPTSIGKRLLLIGVRLVGICPDRLSSFFHFSAVIGFCVDRQKSNRQKSIGGSRWAKVG